VKRWPERMRADYRWALPVLGLVLGVRVAVVTIAATGARMMAQGTFPGILRSWDRKDALWYIKIASQGYVYPASPPANASSVNFFPLYPMAIGLVERVIGLVAQQNSYLIAGMLVSWVCFLAACLLLYRLVEDRFASSVAYTSVLLVAVYSFGFYFGAAYSESLYFLLAVLAFWAAERGTWLLASVAASLASAARPPGLAVGFCVVLMYALDWLRARHKLRWDILALLLTPVGFMSYLLYSWVRFGDPTAYFKASAAGWGTQLHLGNMHVVTWLLSHPGIWFSGGPEAPLYVLYALMLLVVLASCIPMWRLLGPPYVLFALASSLGPLIEVNGFNGMGRYYSIIFPTFIVLAYLLRNRPVLRDVVVITFALGLAFAAIGFTGAYGFS
jgi:hypothetical protein